MKKYISPGPFLFAVFPVISLYAMNVRETSFSEALPPLIAVTAFTLILQLGLGLAIRDGYKSGVYASVCLLFIFSFGHAARIPSILTHNRYQGQTNLLLAAWLDIFLITSYFLLKSKRNFKRAAQVFTFSGIVLLAIPAFDVAHYFLTKPALQKQPAPASINAVRRPDIYYIILDGHPSTDTLRRIFNYDNSEFIDGLEKQGFFVAVESLANYPQTYLSLASSLNYEYLDKFANRKANDRIPLKEMINNNRALDFLKRLGYRFVVFSSGYSAAEITNADYFCAPWFHTTDFQKALINNTVLSAAFQKMQYKLYKKGILYILDKLPTMTAGDGPVFVFAHIVIPHPPFVFGPNGEDIEQSRPFSFLDGNLGGFNDDKEAYKEHYKNQVKYIDGRIKDIIREIIANSSEPPVIILQGDHGSGYGLDWNDLDKTDLRERMGILNAYYLPGTENKGLYRGISPVNTFRVVFNNYFNAQYPLLDDETFFSLWARRYDFINVTDKLKTTPRETASR